MIWQHGATVTCANDGLIRLNKFVSRIIEDLCNLFYYYYLNTTTCHRHVTLLTLDLNKVEYPRLAWWSAKSSELFVPAGACNSIFSLLIYWGILLRDTEEWRYLPPDTANSLIGSVPLWITVYLTEDTAVITLLFSVILERENFENDARCP